MNGLFKKCMFFSTIITLPFVIGPGGLVLYFMVIRAALSMFENNILAQFLVIVLVILIALIPIMLVALIFYGICRFFIELATPTAPAVASATAVAINTPTPKIYDDKIIDGEWTEVD